MNINFEYYKIFYYVAKNKNITKAAEELHISQPALSRMLKVMEEQLNTTLFIRKSKGVSLTKEGEELYKLIGAEIDHIIKAENTFSKITSCKNIKIAVNETILNYLIFNNKIDKVIKNNNNISFFNTNDFDLLNNQLVNNLIDFALVIEPTNYQFSDNIVFRKIEELHIIFISKNKNDSIQNKTLVLQDKSSKFGNLTYDCLQANQLIPKKVITVSDYNNILPFIKNGYANGFVIEEFISSEINNKLVYKIPLSKEMPIINIGLLYNKNNELKIQNIL